MALPTDTAHINTVLVRLGSAYLSGEVYDKAKEIFLHACSRRPSAITWLGVGIACYRLGELPDAEQALTEANIYDSSNAEVWAYLALICTRLRRRLEAEQSVRYAVKCQLDDASLIDELRLELSEADYSSTFLDFEAALAH